jgi:hypothetical protein
MIIADSLQQLASKPPPLQRFPKLPGITYRDLNPDSIHALGRYEQARFPSLFSPCLHRACQNWVARVMGTRNGQKAPMLPEPLVRVEASDAVVRAHQTS